MDCFKCFKRKKIKPIDSNIKPRIYSYSPKSQLSPLRKKLEEQRIIAWFDLKN